MKRRRAPRRSPSNLPPLQTTTTEYSSADMGANEPITRNRAAAFDGEGKMSRFSSIPSRIFVVIRVTPSIMATAVLRLIGASESTPFYLFPNNACHSNQGSSHEISSELDFLRPTSPYISHSFSSNSFESFLLLMGKIIYIYACILFRN